MALLIMVMVVSMFVVMVVVMVVFMIVVVIVVVVMFMIVSTMIVIVVMVVVMIVSMIVVVIMLVIRAVVVSMSIAVSMSRALLTAGMDVAALSRVQYFDLNQVEEERCHGNDQHELALNSWRVKEALGCLVEKPDSHYPDREDRAESAQNFNSVIAVGVFRVGLPVSDLQSTD